MFINKQIDEFVRYLDENFVFIADYDSLFLHGISQFMNYIKEECVTIMIVQLIFVDMDRQYFSMPSMSFTCPTKSGSIYPYANL